MYHRESVAWFGGDSVALFGPSGGMAQHDAGDLHTAGPLKVGAHIDPHQPVVGTNRLLAVVETQDGEPVTDASVEAVAVMPAMGSMPEMRASAQFEHVEDGRYVGDLELTMAGGWPLTLKVDSATHGKATLHLDLATTIEGLRLTDASGTGGKGSTTASKPINDVCPILDNPIPANAPTVEWSGHTIGFCCPGCDTDFLAWPDEKKQAFVARFVSAVSAEPSDEVTRSGDGPINDLCPILGGEVPPDAATVTWNGHIIGFCCPPCEADWKALPDDEKRAFVDEWLVQQTGSTPATAPAPQPETQSATQPQEPLAEGVAFWTCSMHPSVKSKDPGTCPICKMDLTPVTHEEVQSGVIFVDAQRRQLIGVRTTTVLEQSLEKTMRAVGIVTFDETRLADVTLKYRGWIGDMFADYTGKHVEKGEPLFTVYSPELLSAQQEYLDAHAARSGTDRAGRLLESSRNRLRLWDLTEDQIEELIERGTPLQYMPILSPATGTIVHKMAVRGSAVEPGQKIYRIADLSTLWVEAELYEDEIPIVEVGQQVDISVAYLPGRRLEGTVSYIYPYLDPKTRRGRVRIEVANEDGLLKPEMYADVHISVPLGTRLAVPEEAILYGGENNVVFLDLGEGRIRPQRVTLGVRTAAPEMGVNLVEVLDGLEAGDSVVTSGNFLIASESKLKSGIEKW